MDTEDINRFIGILVDEVITEELGPTIKAEINENIKALKEYIRSEIREEVEAKNLGALLSGRA